MAIDPRTVRALENPPQLGSRLRENEVGARKALKKFLNVDWLKKQEFLVPLLQRLLYAESAIQKLRVKVIVMVAQIAEQLSLRTVNQRGKAQNSVGIIRNLRKILLDLDKEQANESKKVIETRYFIRDSIKRIDIAAMQAKRANDNFARAGSGQDDSKKAA